MGGAELCGDSSLDDFLMEGSGPSGGARRNSEMAGAGAVWLPTCRSVWHAWGVTESSCKLKGALNISSLNLRGQLPNAIDFCFRTIDPGQLFLTIGR